MPIQYTQEQIDRAINSLPEELKEALFSIETADAIRNACTKQGVVDERLGKIAETTGYVLMGLVQPSQFENILKKDIGLKKMSAEEIAREINRFVFFPVKAALEQLHEIPAQKPLSKSPGPNVDKKEITSEKPRRTSSDKYRESIE